jgi:hypothetical protein
MARNNSNNTTIPPSLSSDQQQEIDSLMAQIDTYTKRLNEVQQKRNKIKTILDNFDDVVLGNVIINLLPDLQTTDILEAPIINSIEINLKAATTGAFYPFRQFINGTTTAIITSDTATAVIGASNGELNSSELPLPVWLSIGEEISSISPFYATGMAYLRQILAMIANDI